MGKITLIASIHSIKIDDMGETKVTFTVPLLNLPDILELGKLTQKIVVVNVEPQSDGLVIGK
jgi:hypothetical protein